VSNHLAVASALADLKANPEQDAAARKREHCVVLAGPGSGKTKTLTTAIARTLVEDVIDPRGIACITYNNECAIELETRLAKLGIVSSERNFIGTVHSFALTQVIAPYARCISGLLPGNYRVATQDQARAAVEVAYDSVFDEPGNPQERWCFAEVKRRRDVDRTAEAWRGDNPELADFILAYEAELRNKGLIDFDDMPLIAFRMIKDHRWIREALRARFPVLFVDEYQDLGHALHELVLLLCFDGGIRLFAVGDADQSIYGFTGANPELLLQLTERVGVETIRLRFNYRSGAKIIRASLGARSAIIEVLTIGQRANSRFGRSRAITTVKLNTLPKQCCRNCLIKGFNWSKLQFFIARPGSATRLLERSKASELHSSAPTPML
jgi:DNA helicase-2/ATP-dependent DNA helicase PcrA